MMAAQNIFDVSLDGHSRIQRDNLVSSAIENLTDKLLCVFTAVVFVLLTFVIETLTSGTLEMINGR